jgi:hypothetical protein
MYEIIDIKKVRNETKETETRKKTTRKSNCKLTQLLRPVGCSHDQHAVIVAPAYAVELHEKFCFYTPRALKLAILIRSCAVCSCVSQGNEREGITETDKRIGKAVKSTTPTWRADNNESISSMNIMHGWKTFATANSVFTSFSPSL